MRIRSFAVAAVAALLVPAAPAFAGDPTMPLSQVQAGMQCTGRSVIQGTTISTFDVTVLDVAAGGRDNGAPGPRPQYHPGYYGAFVLDPDGNNVEAVCHKPG
jgi:hypothetical protein